MTVATSLPLYTHLRIKPSTREPTTWLTSGLQGSHPCCNTLLPLLSHAMPFLVSQILRKACPLPGVPRPEQAGTREGTPGTEFSQRPSKGCHTQFTVEDTKPEVGGHLLIEQVSGARLPAQVGWCSVPSPGLAASLLPAGPCLSPLLSPGSCSICTLFANGLKSFQACSPGFLPRPHALSARALTSSLLQMGHLECNAGPWAWQIDFYQH